MISNSVGIDFIHSDIHGRLSKKCVLITPHWFRWWLVGCSAPTHYLNQYCLIDNLNLRNKFQWNLNQNKTIFRQENEFQNKCYRQDVSHFVSASMWDAHVHSLGSNLMICFISSSNPMSNIRSASSMMRHCRFLYMNSGVFWKTITTNGIYNLRYIINGIHNNTCIWKCHE